MNHLIIILLLFVVVAAFLIIIYNQNKIYNIYGTYESYMVGSNEKDNRNKILVKDIPSHIKSDVKIIKKIGQGLSGVAYLCEDNKLLKIAISMNDSTKMFETYQERMENLIKDAKPHNIIFPRLYNFIVYKNPGFYMLDDNTPWKYDLIIKEAHLSAPFIVETISDYIPGEPISKIFKGETNKEQNMDMLKKSLIADYLLVKHKIKASDTSMGNRVYDKNTKQLGKIDIDININMDHLNDKMINIVGNQTMLRIMSSFILTYLSKKHNTKFDDILSYIHPMKRLELQDLMDKYTSKDNLFIRLFDYKTVYLKPNMTKMAKIIMLIYLFAEDIFIDTMTQMTTDIHDINPVNKKKLIEIFHAIIKNKGHEYLGINE